jgi:hypothetical protein
MRPDNIAQATPLQAKDLELQKPSAPAKPATAADPHEGAGGSYEIDAATGVRRLVERTAPPGPPPATD